MLYSPPLEGLGEALHISFKMKISSSWRQVAVISIIAIFALGYILPMFKGCGAATDTPPTPAATPKPLVQAPEFAADTAFAAVAKQVSFGPRVTNSAPHKACKTWLIKQFKSYGAEIIEQNFTAKRYDGVVLNGTNIVARFNPSLPNRVMLSSHWDSRHLADKDPNKANQTKPILGADDGASGVGILIEVARTIKNNPISIGVDIVLFDAEDYGDPKGEDEASLATWCLGAQHWAKNPHVAGYQARFGILLDMAGAKDARFALEGISMQAAPEIMKKVWNIGQHLGYGNFFVSEPSQGTTDDHYYVNQYGIPMIDIINRMPDGNFAPYHHTQNDNLSIIDTRTLKAVGQTVLAAIYNEANTSF